MQYKMLIEGGITPQLTLEFTMASDAMAADYCQRIIPNIASDHYWNFNLFCVDASNPHHVARFHGKRTVIVEVI